MTKIAVDLTPVRSGGENGGAKIVATELLKEFRNHVPRHQFFLLTASWNHDELTSLDAPNIKRICILDCDRVEQQQSRKGFIFILFDQIRNFFRSLLGGEKVSGRKMGLLESLGVDLLFCPFTSLDNAEPEIPSVSVIHDLQHMDLPHLFEPREIAHRDSFLEYAKDNADCIICVSNTVRESVLSQLKADPEKVFSVPNCIHGRFSLLDGNKLLSVLSHFGLDQKPYCLYPANFWDHKNHRMLLAAFAKFLARNPEKDLDLVLTGALNEQKKEIELAVKKMEIQQRVHLPGFLPEQEFTAIWQGCRFLIFPSLYEGFGIPLLEAMHFSKPILCSNSTSLPEVAGEAALFFDPRKPEQIIGAIEKILDDPVLEKELIQKGRSRLLQFHPSDMAKKYLELFDSTMEQHLHLSGIYADGWTQGEFFVVASSVTFRRSLVIRFSLPSYLPLESINLKMTGITRLKRRWKLKKGQSMEVRIRLPKRKHRINFKVSETFQPQAFGLGEDQRRLGLRCESCLLDSEKFGEKILV